MKNKKSLHNYEVATPTLRSYLIDEVTLMAMLYDAYYTEFDLEIDNPDLMLQDIISEHLLRGEIKEL